MPSDDQPMTHLEAQARRVVGAIQAKGPELTLAVFEDLREVATRIVHPWLLSSQTSPGKYQIVHQKALSSVVAARVYREDGKWNWHTIDSGRGRADTVREAMDAADAKLLLDGATIMPGYPTAAPWEHNAEANWWARIIEGGASKSELVRVFKQEGNGSQWFWKLTHLSGPGPTEANGPWATAQGAMREADIALENTGWMLTT